MVSLLVQGRLWMEFSWMTNEKASTSGNWSERERQRQREEKGKQKQWEGVRLVC